MSKPKVLLFDLGGVIVRWVGLDELAKITGRPRETVIDQFAGSDIFNTYETGQCGDDEFAAELNQLFDLGLALKDTKSLWNSWVQESYDGTKDMLSELRKDYRIACLSNTNALHWAHGRIYPRILMLMPISMTALPRISLRRLNRPQKAILFRFRIWA